MSLGANVYPCDKNALESSMHCMVHRPSFEDTHTATQHYDLHSIFCLQLYTMIYNIDPNVHGKSNAIFKIFINFWIFKYELLKLLYRMMLLGYFRCLWIFKTLLHERNKVFRKTLINVFQMSYIRGKKD